MTLASHSVCWLPSRPTKTRVASKAMLFSVTTKTITVPWFPLSPSRSHALRCRSHGRQSHEIVLFDRPSSLSLCRLKPPHASMWFVIFGKTCKLFGAFYIVHKWNGHKWEHVLRLNTLHTALSQTNTRSARIWSQYLDWCWHNIHSPNACSHGPNDVRLGRGRHLYYSAAYFFPSSALDSDSQSANATRHTRTHTQTHMRCDTIHTTRTQHQIPMRRYLSHIRP